MNYFTFVIIILAIICFSIILLSKSKKTIKNDLSSMRKMGEEAAKQRIFHALGLFNMMPTSEIQEDLLFHYMWNQKWSNGIVKATVYWVENFREPNLRGKRPSYVEDLGVNVLLPNGSEFLYSFTNTFSDSLLHFEEVKKNN